ncbi:NAD(P)H-dependent oxidoreductase [Halofilum ochraceum]|uniref:NAD(P)H-dependent oxidoreductase n=1 Tax=Halofilum ochraceum TaxID=1611323 RepID=UPI0008D9B401|nr:NAD(P)H-dependent oxidoreductase [Halofilum ochraceum]
MPASILIIQGHPDPDQKHFCHALADAYAEAAEQAGHSVRRVEIARLEFPLIRQAEDWKHGEAPPAIADVQAELLRAGHIVIIYPLWLGTMPALLKGFLEQVFRQSFAFGADPMRPERKLRGRSARVVVTMGMPGWIYRAYFMAHGLKNLERNILRFCGIRPVRSSLVGMVEGDSARRGRWLERMRRLGAAAR